MAIQTVQAIINGQSYTLALNSATGKYEATITAPGKTSYNQSGGYYNVQIKATNDAGTVGSADASTLDGLKLFVKEKVAPVINILSTSSGAYVSNSKQPVVFTVTDETDGSGVDLSTLVVKQDGAAGASSAGVLSAVKLSAVGSSTPSTGALLLMVSPEAGWLPPVLPSKVPLSSRTLKMMEATSATAQSTRRVIAFLRISLMIHVPLVVELVLGVL